MFKIKFSSLTRISLATPSEFTGKLDNGDDVRFHFRHGRLKIFLNSNEIIQTEKDEFDLSGYLSDDDLKMLMRKHSLLDE